MSTSFSKSASSKTIMNIQEINKYYVDHYWK